MKDNVQFGLIFVLSCKSNDLVRSIKKEISICSLKKSDYFYTTQKHITMKKNLFLAVFSIISLTAFSQKGPIIEFKAKDNTIDYGKVYKDNDNGVRVFEFTNTGDAPLIITNVKSTCGCTVPSKPKEPIMPGKSDKIEVKYNMATGPIRKSITVETNAVNSESGKVHLKIKGEVLERPEVNLMEKKKVGPMQ